MATKKYKQGGKKDIHNVSEPQASYNIDVNALKLSGIHALMSIDNPVVLEKAVESLLETARQSLEKSIITEEEETISKEEILAGIREGLQEMKERHRTGRRGIHLQELIDIYDKAERDNITPREIKALLAELDAQTI
jgi:predicted Zn-dependent peptidase